MAGRHIIRLQTTLRGFQETDRTEAIANAVELFRNVVGLEIIDDAVRAGEWPMSNANNGPTETPGEWDRMRHS